ncbi:MAG TPA: SDR family oxidoreductase [Thermomicrobiales bacterium]|nr:SDR family oxidoreductase [Thermomicrobiales bacterium]
MTGATGRIGRAIVATFAGRGVRVVASDVDAARLEEMARSIDGVTPIAADVTSEDDLVRLAAGAIEATGQIDALVNCAGIFPNTPVVRMDTAEWDRVYAVNLRGPFILSREIGRHMIDRGIHGSIVNISSGAGSSARTGGSHYCGSKAALEMLTKVMAIELGPHGIRVNAVAPGLIVNEVLSLPVPEGADDYVGTLLRGIPLGRTGRPEDIANTVAFLCSDEAEWVSGAVWGVNGGSQAGRTHLPPSAF